MTRPLALGLDLGSTSVKAARLDADGRLRDVAAVPSPELTGDGPIREADAEARVGARAQVDGDQVDLVHAEPGGAGEVADRGGDLASVHHPLLKEPGPEDLVAVEKSDAPSRPGRLDAEDLHPSREVYRGGWGSQVITYKI